MKNHLVESSTYLMSNKFAYSLIVIALCKAGEYVDVNHLDKISSTPGQYNFGVGEYSYQNQNKHPRKTMFGKYEKLEIEYISYMFNMYTYKKMTSLRTHPKQPNNYFQCLPSISNRYTVGLVVLATCFIQAPQMCTHVDVRLE